MSDDADFNDEKAAVMMNATLSSLHQKAVQETRTLFIPGECESCGEDSERLVEVHGRSGLMWSCAPCRDKYKYKVAKQ